MKTYTLNIDGLDALTIKGSNYEDAMQKGLKAIAERISVGQTFEIYQDDLKYCEVKFY